MKDLRHRILLILLTLTIIGEIASIFLWVSNRPIGGEPFSRFTLAVNYTVAVANAAVFAELNAIALILVVRRNKIGPLILIGVSILNRVVSYPLFIGGAHGVFITWTALLVIFAYVEYRGLSNFEILFLSGGVIFDLVASALLFSAAKTPIFGLGFYFIFLALLVGIVAAIKKLR